MTNGDLKKTCLLMTRCYYAKNVLAKIIINFKYITLCAFKGSQNTDGVKLSKHNHNIRY